MPQIQSWLVGQLAGRLFGITVLISRGQYGRAGGALDDYGSVLADATSKYERTLAEYREGRGNGNT